MSLDGSSAACLFDVASSRALAGRLLLALDEPSDWLRPSDEGAGISRGRIRPMRGFSCRTTSTSNTPQVRYQKGTKTVYVGVP